MSEQTPHYRSAGTAMLRASVHSAHAELPPWPEESAGPEAWRSWLTAAWTLPRVAESAALASPHLAGQIEAVCAGGQPEERRVCRMAWALARYLLRARGRATPFGIFAGVAPATFGDRARWEWSDHHRVRLGADAVWLADVTARLEACPTLLARLSVVVNDLAVVRGGRIVVPWQPHQSPPSGDGREQERSVRLVPVVDTIRHTATAPILVGDLLDRTRTVQPSAGHEALQAVVGQLVAAQVLISSLRAPSTTTDVLAHLLDQLDAARADELPETKPLVDALRDVHRRLHTGKDRPGTSRVMSALSPIATQPVTADLRLGGSLTLPHSVAAEAAAAACALIRLAPATAAGASWRVYHRDFLARYGAGALVPVAELTDPARGLGLPRHFTRPSPAAQEMTGREQALFSLVQQAALDGAQDIVLDDAALERIAPAHESRRPVTAAEVWVDIRAESTGAVDKGAFTLGVCGFGRAGAGTGRFLDLLDTEDAGRRWAAQPPSVEEAALAQLSFPPRNRRTENVLRVPTVLPHVIPLAEHRASDGRCIQVADLAVAADSARLYVVWRSRQQVVEPAIPHAGARHAMPPLARFLWEIPRSPHPAVTSFAWGAAACLPFLPRLRYGRSILAPAAWRFEQADLPSLAAPEADWSAELDTLRGRRRLPDHVAVADGDRRLRLDLREPMDRAVLRGHLQAADGPVILTEMPTAADHGWCRGRAHEVVIPLVATARPDPAPAFLTGSAPLPVTAPDDGVVFAKLHGPPGAFDAVLARIPALLRRWPTPPPWWFARYVHPTPHLRLRMHDPDRRRASGHVAAWTADLRREGLASEVSFDTYRPETGRYGTGSVMAAAEELFAADSDAVLAQLACLAATRRLHARALTAASLVDLAAALRGSRQAGVSWLLDHPECAEGAGSLDRALRHQTLRIVDRVELAGLIGGTAVRAAWQARAEAADRYAAALKAHQGGVRPSTVLGSLLHMHHVRARGIDPAGEAAVYKLARAAALTLANRRTGGEL